MLINNGFNVNSFASNNELILETAIKSNNLIIIELIAQSNDLHFYYSDIDRAQESALSFQSLQNDASSDIYFALFSINKFTDPRIVEILIVKFYLSLKMKFENCNEIFTKSLLKMHVDKHNIDRFYKNKPKKLTNFIKKLVEIDAYEQIASVFKQIICVSVIDDLISALLVAISYALYYGAKDSWVVLMEIYETSGIELNYLILTTENRIFNEFKEEIWFPTIKKDGKKDSNKKNALSILSWYLLISNNPVPDLAKKLIKYDYDFFLASDRYIQKSLILYLKQKKCQPHHMIYKQSYIQLAETLANIVDSIYADKKHDFINFDLCLILDALIMIDDSDRFEHLILKYSDIMLENRFVKQYDGKIS